MKKKIAIRDDNTAPHSVLSCTTRNKLFGSLCAAKNSLTDDHEAHSHLDRCIKTLGGQVIDAETRNEVPMNGASQSSSSDLTSPGSFGRPSAASIAQTSVKSARLAKSENARRDELSALLYTAAAKEHDKDKKNALEKIAQGIDSGNFPLPEQLDPGEAQGADFLARHGFGPARKAARSDFGTRHPLL